MLYKTPQIQADFEDQVERNEYNLKLREWLEIIDKISVLTGHGEVTMTDYFRTSDKWVVSLHYKQYGGRAADLRVRDKSTLWYLAMNLIGLAFDMLNPKLRMNIHPELYNSPNKHIHIEVRT